jgi:cation diffusion facilitator CzcD-associated flavoprotein CzcO
VWSEYEDFPTPDEYPDYPSHRQLQACFESYARTFGVYERIRFNHVVQKIMRLPAGDWRVEYQDAEGADHVEQFDVLMIANGHPWDPKYPDYPGTFNGKFIHSHDFKKVDDSWRGKDVLVIGGGNGLLNSVANAGRSYLSSDGLDGRRKSKRHETVWRAVASRKGSWDNRRRNLATIPEILPGAARLDDKRSATRRIYASACSSTGSYASADAIGFTVSMAAASSSTGWKRRVDRRRICFATAGPVSLSRINGRLGQRAFSHLPFPRHP